MKVLVCLHAPRPSDGELGRDDARALGLAFDLGAPHAVTALLAGGPPEAGPLRRALGAGAKRAVRLIGEEFALADFHTLGQALATGIKRLGADLVLMGSRSDDDGLGAVPASAARHLGYLHVAGVESLAVAKTDGGGDEDPQFVEVTVRGGGRRRRLRVPLPAVLSVAGGAARAFPAPEGQGQAGDGDKPGDKPGDIEILSLADPDATVVRRRTELLGQPELAARETAQVTSAAALVDALLRK